MKSPATPDLRSCEEQSVSDRQRSRHTEAIVQTARAIKESQLILDRVYELLASEQQTLESAGHQERRGR